MSLHIDDVRLSFTSLKQSDSFPECPPFVIQWRKIPSYEWGADRSLWRTASCNAGRWHYAENPCNCAYPNLTGLAMFRRAGFSIHAVEPESGTWKRDFRRIAIHMRGFRAELARQREADVIGRAAVGPRPLALLYCGTPIYFDADFSGIEARVHAYLQWKKLCKPTNSKRRAKR